MIFLFVRLPFWLRLTCVLVIMASIGIIAGVEEKNVERQFQNEFGEQWQAHFEANQGSLRFNRAKPYLFGGGGLLAALVIMILIRQYGDPQSKPKRRRRR